MSKRKRNEEEEETTNDVKYNMNSVGFRGVSKSGQRFQAKITIDSKLQSLGSFDTPEEAAQAYDRVAIQAGRPTSTLNFLDQVPKNYTPINNGLNPRNTTGYTGVRKTKGNRFRAEIRIDGNMQNLGTFDTPKEAAEAFECAAILAGRPPTKPAYVPMKKKLKANNTIGFRGVSKVGNRFQARIRIEGKRKTLGTFDTPKEAAEAYDYAAIQTGHPTSNLNFLDQVPKNYKPKKKKLQSHNTIGYRGVYKTRNRFQASIYFGGKEHHIGMFGEAKEAAIAFDIAAIQAKRPKCDLNFPDMIHTKAMKNKILNKKKKKKKKKSKTRRWCTHTSLFYFMYIRIVLFYYFFFKLYGLLAT